jgi:16S rRNA processing protein RimM
VADRSSELRAGRVGRAHGLDGSFYVTRALPRVLRLGASVVVAGKTAVIVRRAGTEERPIVRVEGIVDREAAEALRGAELTVPAAHAPPLEEGEWWAHELEGCVVRDGVERIGTVRRLIELPSCEALEVQRPGAREGVLVPMVKDVIRSVDVARGEIDVDSEFLGLGAEAADAPENGPPGEAPAEEGHGGGA